MLNGIGGRTVDEAKFNLSHVEFLDWVAYANQKGTLNLGLRIEYGFALLAFLLTKGFKIKKDGNQQFTLQDFMPHIKSDDDEDSDGVTLTAVARALGVKM